MANLNTKIEWTDATWNCVTGCTKVSAGCKNCYAERLFPRPYPGRAFTDVRCHPERLDAPLHWRKPRRVFVASMSDTFHEALPDDFLDRIFAVVAMCPQHSFQNLTKRPENQRRYFSDPQTPFRILRAMDTILVDIDMRDVAEKWHPVIGWTKYEVSNYGEVRREGKKLAQAEHSGGYRQVALCENGEPTTRLVHAIVLEAFRGVRGDAFEARHRNGNRADNRLANLLWGSKAENMQDSARHGTAGVWMKDRATLTPDQVAEIRRRRVAGEKLDDIAAAVGSTRKQVSAVALGKIFKPARIEWPLRNLWLGVSCEDQATAEERIPLLLQTPAAVRFLSCEPLLGPISFEGCWVEYSDPAIHENWLERLDWVIAGGESGPNARPSHPDWFRSIKDQCQAVGVAFFMKQITERGRKVPYEAFPPELQIREYPL